MNNRIRRIFFFGMAAALFPFACPSGLSDQQVPPHKPGVLREVWRDIKGRMVEDLVKDPAYLKPAPEKEVVAAIDDGSLGEQYGVRYTALLSVPETGDYTFYIASDDSSELWLGKDATQNDMSCVCFVKGYTHKKNWSSQMNQKSPVVRLEKGRKYYVSVLHKQEFSAAFVSLAWTGPGIDEITVIPKEVFSLPE